MLCLIEQQQKAHWNFKEKRVRLSASLLNMEHRKCAGRKGTANVKYVLSVEKRFLKTPDKTTLKSSGNIHETRWNDRLYWPFLRLTLIYITHKCSYLIENTEHTLRFYQKELQVSAVYCQNHTQHINTSCEKVHNLLMLQQVVHILTTLLQEFKRGSNFKLNAALPTPAQIQLLYSFKVHHDVMGSVSLNTDLPVRTLALCPASGFIRTSGYIV
jgi:hypothetical protein